MKRQLAFFFILLAFLSLVTTLPLLALRFAFLTPTLYRRCLRMSNFFLLLSRHLAFDLPRQITEDFWSPWTPRDSELLRVIFSTVFASPQIEAALVDWGLSGAKWSLGLREHPLSLLDLASGYVSGPAGAHIEALLWQSLPLCAAAEEAHCRPREAGARPVVGQQQHAWWGYFTADMLAWLEVQEAQYFSKMSPPLPLWVHNLVYVPLLALLGVLIAFFLLSGAQRWLAWSIPIGGSGAVLSLVGLLTMLHMLPSPVIGTEVGTLVANAVSALWPPLWLAMSTVLGATLYISGAAALIVGLLPLVWLVRPGWGKGGILAAIGLALLGGLYAFPLSVFATEPALPVSVSLPTPTPWPTLTQTSTSTPTPTITPTPFVPYWPVSTGTPMPTPAASLDATMSLLGCVQQADEPVLALDVVGDVLYVVQRSHVSRRVFATLVLVDVSSPPFTMTEFALASSGQQIALAQENDLYLYALPSWTRDLRSRVSTFSPIKQLTYVTGRGQLVLGLDNGYLWVTNPNTGALVWLLPAHAAPVTALVAHPRYPRVLSGSEQGDIRLWYMDAGREQAVLEGHHSAVQALAFSPSGARALSVDAQGLLILWNLRTQQIVRQRELADQSLTQLHWVTNDLIIGAVDSNLVFLDTELRLSQVSMAASPITALALQSDAYIMVATEKGQICVWATLGPVTE